MCSRSAVKRLQNIARPLRGDDERLQIRCPKEGSNPIDRVRADENSLAFYCVISNWAIK
jgi:hypothetical protein